MEIDIQAMSEIAIKDMNRGECFLRKGHLMMKTEEFDINCAEGVNAVDLHTGELFWLDYEESYFPINNLKVVKK